jgi:hypothetical protein
MDTCVKTSDNFLLFDNVVLHVLILFTIVSSLFIFVIAKLESKSINNEFKNMIDEFVNPDKIKAILTLRKSIPELEKAIAEKLKINKDEPQQKVILDKITGYITSMEDTDLASLKKFLESMENDYLKNDHILRKEINKKVHEEIGIVIFFFIVIALLIYFFATKMGKYCGFMKHLAIELLVIFACVGVIEFWFFTNVASKYVPVKPTVIITTFKNTLIDKINGKVNK